MKSCFHVAKGPGEMAPPIARTAILGWIGTNYYPLLNISESPLATVCLCQLEGATNDMQGFEG